MFHHMPKWFLLAVLLLGQTTLLAHQSDLDAHSGSSENCPVCHITSSMDAISVGKSTHAVNPVRGKIQLPVISAHCPSAFTHIPNSRAPPVIHVTPILG